MLNGRKGNKPSDSVKEADLLELKAKPKYVSRGGLKLEGALDAFGIDPKNLVCLDVGASTGGFTDCLLQRGARKVYAFDVGTNQLVWKLRSDPRVISREQFNVRHMVPEDIGEPIDLTVMDVSFISLTQVLPAVFQVLAPLHGQVVCLIKPQFELKREEVGKGGIVRDAALHERAVEKIQHFVAQQADFRWNGLIPSPITGTDGNAEFLAWIARSSAGH
jgi:23S rRNA (cytidine1920-2'-O)/16S rRNA (cytidine1409-2'-O)-methyltransferase